MKSSAKSINLTSLDDLFSTEESRAEESCEKVVRIPLTELHPFPNHPFHVRDDEAISTSAAALCMIFVMLPCFLLAMYEKQGLPLEKILRNMIRVYFIRPKHRPYETNNFYSALARQEKLDKEVQRIVYGKAAHKSRQAAD